MLTSIPAYKLLSKLSEYKLTKVLAHPHDKIYEVVNGNVEINKFIGNWSDKKTLQIPSPNDKN